MEYIRKLNINDLQQMLDIRIDLQNHDLFYCSKDNIVLDEVTLLKKTKLYIKNHLDKDLFMFGYFIDDKLVANCGFYIDEHFPTYNNASGNYAYICNVFTKEEYRKRGYQRKIFFECLEYAKKLGITSFKLSSKNENAIKMYKSFGFKNIDYMYSYKVKL